jgi:uncharacterized protein YdaU (DUF1376 family)
MHYYQFNIADYRKDTSHLSRLEHSIYRDLIDWYYLDEAPIPKETQSVTRRLRLGTQEEAEALSNVLNDFFYLSDSGWNHKRIDMEIADYHSKCGKNKENGKKGGRPKSTPEPVKTQSVNLANPNESESNPNHKPLTINHKPSIKENKKENPFLLPDWIKPDDWDLWMKTRKGKKMIPAQLQKQVDKLRKWKDTGQDHAGALELAAINGYTGLYLPGNKAPPAKKQKFCSTELMYGMDGYGNKISEESNERVINPN